MIKDFANALNKELQREIDGLADDVSTGGCKSFDKYQHLCGIIRGLMMAQQQLMDMAKNAERDED